MVLLATLAALDALVAALLAASIAELIELWAAAIDDNNEATEALSGLALDNALVVSAATLAVYKAADCAAELACTAAELAVEVAVEVALVIAFKANKLAAAVDEADVKTSDDCCPVVFATSTAEL
ncbi:homocysteine S-methyltransferase [Weissella oryzae SG25]|uniref:Homocysteine S-methyltransferase n=1 Tax=Weissella oryzae (strain DSM 25784 / JCM 18191 / LMG 30913 / SG25) TaxID=1329250 RepID=A0A069CWV4_WEIOS|nr:homocysteine S-methyltransferase [Weissella oryzae SG25]